MNKMDESSCTIIEENDRENSPDPLSEKDIDIVIEENG